MEEVHYISSKYKDNNSDIYSKIVETKEEIENLKKNRKNYLSYIHCNGCFRKCPLSNSNCGRGQNLKIKFSPILIRKLNF